MVALLGESLSQVEVDEMDVKMVDWGQRCHPSQFDEMDVNSSSDWEQQGQQVDELE
jgi:hypothetical protein